jgi:hypothetical protein
MSKPLRYKIQQNKGIYCLKGCEDGDLVDYSEYARLSAELAEAKHYRDSYNQEASKYLAQRDHAHRQCDALRSALERIIQWEQQPQGPDPIGPLHGAGINRALKFCADIAREALSGTQRTAQCVVSNYNGDLCTLPEGHSGTHRIADHATEGQSK